VSVVLENLSGKPKAGVKGPRAAAWLAAQGIDVPAQPNTWAGALVGRLAETEFFIEGDAASKLAALRDQLPAGVYPVPREDACFELSGAALHEVLLQVCSVDFQGKHAPDALFMTSMAGVAVLAIPMEQSIRIWADPTFGPYLWNTLSGIVQEITGETT
jgi:sarcosine oxidase subunit gamma